MWHRVTHGTSDTVAALLAGYQPIAPLDSSLLTITPHTVGLFTGTLSQRARSFAQARATQGGQGDPSKQACDYHLTMQLQAACPCRRAAVGASRPLAVPLRPLGMRPEAKPLRAATPSPGGAGAGNAAPQQPGGLAQAALRRLPQAALLSACLALAAAPGARALALAAAPPPPPQAAEARAAAPRPAAAVAAATLSAAPAAHRAWSAPEALRYKILKVRRGRARACGSPPTI